jgi:hypothetical protein
MKKYLTIFLKVLLSLILIMPVLGILGIFPPPTAEMYSSKEAFAFIEVLMQGKYINYLMFAVFAISLVLIWIDRTALAAFLLLPITLNIVGFHAFMDGGLLTGGAVMGNVLLLLNIYFLWQGKNRLLPLLFKKDAVS